MLRCLGSWAKLQNSEMDLLVFLNLYWHLRTRLPLVLSKWGLFCTAVMGSEGKTVLYGAGR